MIIMNLKIDNYLLFKDFEMNMSYPKKIVNSGIVEWLDDRPNFRFKKIVILMGANATGKTALGKVIMMIFNFIYRKEYSLITGMIEDKKRKASFEMDFVLEDNFLYRIKTVVLPSNEGNYETKNIRVSVEKEKIKKEDNYETCSKRLKLLNADSTNYITELEKIPNFSWMFEYPFASDGKHTLKPINEEIYCKYLKNVLKVLDPRIIDVTRIKSSKNTYTIKRKNDQILIRNGKLIEQERLSSGTQEGIGIANIMATLKLRGCDFYYCDEKFSHVHSEAEKSFLSVFAELLDKHQQMFFTTHNSKILDLDFPMHTYAFMRRDRYDNNVTCLYASDYIKKNDISLKKAVENDIFSAEPSVSEIFDLIEIGEENG